MPCNSVPRVLHVHSDYARTSDTVEVADLIDAASLAVEHGHDVYRALARLCRAPGGTYRAVIVCVDTLDVPEMEFFTLASRLSGGPPVYAYGCERSAELVREAVAAGASGRVSPSLIESLAADDTIEQDLRPAHSVPVAEPEAEWPRVVPEASNTADSARAANDEDAPEPAADHGHDESESEAPVRVPWLRYGDGPSRAAPPAPPSAGREAPDPRPVPDRAASDEPLLTEAELHALLGDDIAAIAPEAEPHGDDTGWDGEGGVP